MPASGDAVVAGLICGRMHGILVQVQRALVGSQPANAIYKAVPLCFCGTRLVGEWEMHPSQG